MTTTHKFTACAGAALAILALPGAARADNYTGYGVATAAKVANVYGSGGAWVSAYRTGSDSSFNYTIPGDRPSETIQGCNFLPSDNVNCSGAAFGTGGSDFNLTASNSAASLRDDVGYQPPTFASGSVTSHADIATGTLGVAATSDIFREVRGGPTFIGTQGFAYLNDTLTFSVADADPWTVTNIAVSFVLDGNLDITNPRGTASVLENFYFGTASARYSAFAAGTLPVYTTTSDSGWVSSSWNLTEAGVARFDGVYALTGASGTLGLANSLAAYAGGGASANYGSTSHIIFNLPNEVTYSSASGQFLRGVPVGPGPGGVPEPATWAMMLLGFGLVGGAVRRRGIVRPVTS